MSQLPSGCQPTEGETERWYGKRPLKLETEGVSGFEGKKGAEGKRSERKSLKINQRPISKG